MTPADALSADLRDLGPLESAEDAKRWLEVLARRSAGGTIDPDDSLAAIRQVREWRAEREEHDL